MYGRNQSYMQQGDTVLEAIKNIMKGTTVDREYTQKLMYPVLNYFDDHKVEKFQNIIQPLSKKKNFKKSSNNSTI